MCVDQGLKKKNWSHMYTVLAMHHLTALDHALVDFKLTEHLAPYNLDCILRL